MKFDIMKLLKDVRVLYVVVFLAITNLIGYLISENYNAVLFFLLVSIIIRFFNHNKTIILGSALILTNLLIGGKIIKESFGGKNYKKKHSGQDKNKTTGGGSSNTKSGMANIHEDENDKEDKNQYMDNQEKMASGKGSQLDYAGTIESAYDNLDKLLSSDALKNMTADTQRLAEKQKRLMGSIKNLEPMMNQANKLLEGLDMSSINSMMGKISNMSIMTGLGENAGSQDKGVGSKK